MAITFATTDPGSLLNSIYELIDGGKIKTWQYDKDRGLYSCHGTVAQ
jgi:hypothetical protein